MDLAVKTSPRGEAEEKLRDNPVQRSLARQRVMLSRRVNAYYDLMALPHLRSATYGFAVEPSNPNGREMRGSPIYSAYLFMRAIPRTPVDRTVAMAVASPPVLAFANSAVARHPQDHARWFLRESCNEADRIACATARRLLALTNKDVYGRAFTGRVTPNQRRL